MNKISKMKRIILTTILTLGVTLCSAVQLTDHSETIYIPKTGSRYAFGSNSLLTYSSDNEKVATVFSNTGRIVAVSEGTATIIGKDSFGNTCDTWHVMVFELKISQENNLTKLRDGKTKISVKVETSPSGLESYVSSQITNLTLVLSDTTGGTNFNNNPNNGGSKITKGKDMFNWEIDNARWYWYTAQSGTQRTAEYKIKGSFSFYGYKIDLKEEKLDIDLESDANNSYCNAAFSFTGMAKFEPDPQNPSALVCTGIGTLKRNLDNYYLNIGFIQTSQFYEMVYAEEHYHLMQYQNPPANSIMTQLGTPEAIRDYIKSKGSIVATDQLTAEQVAQQRNNEAIMAVRAGFGEAMTYPNFGRCTLEKEAKDNATPKPSHVLIYKYAYPLCP